MHILLTGGSGFIGTALSKALVERGDQVTLLKHKRSSKVENVVEVNHLDSVDLPVDAVINLAGLPIADRPWTHSRKLALRASREGITGQLVRWIAQQEHSPSVLISGSAIGFYGATRSDGEMTEQSSPVVSDFSHQLCESWESIAQQAANSGVRVCTLRTGIVLGKGGALKKMLPAFKLGLGGRIVDGKQIMPWIHLDDEVAAILYLLDHPEAEGPFNLTSPNPVTNEAFTRALGQALHRPTWFPMPSLLPKLMLGKEGASLLTEGLSVVPDKLTRLGYRFKFTHIDDALNNLLT